MGKKSGSRGYHHKDLKQTLLGAVREELLEHGAALASLRRIAQRAGVSHAAPYRHFRGRDGLLAALGWEGQAQFTAHLQAARAEAGGSPEERLSRLGAAYLDFARSRPEIMELMFSETGLRVMHAHLPPDLEEEPRRYDSFAVLETTVKECQAAGVLDPAEDSGALAIMIWSFVHGFALIRREGFAAAMGAARGLSGENTERLVLRAFRGLLRGREGG